MLPFDFSILNFIQENLRSGCMDTVMPLITRLGDGGAIWIVLALVLMIHPKTRGTGITVAAALVLEAVCCNLILKPFVARVRPCDINTAVTLLIPRPSDFSFPSGHAGASFAAAAALYKSRSRLWIPALILSCLIAFSRLYLYVHYPTDVLAGALIGILAGWSGGALVELAQEKKRGC